MIKKLKYTSRDSVSTYSLPSNNNKKKLFMDRVFLTTTMKKRQAIYQTGQGKTLMTKKVLDLGQYLMHSGIEKKADQT